MQLSGSVAAGTGLIGRAGLQALIDTLIEQSYTVIAPRLQDGAIGLAPVRGVDDLPVGRRDDQEAGRYRLADGDAGALFDHSAAAQGWKRFLYPPVERLWQARREGGGFTVVADPTPTPRYAFLGVRACDLKAITVLDRVFDHGRAAEPRYVARRDQAVIIGVNCTRAGGTCFCASMGAGPRVGTGADIVLTELPANGEPRLLAEARSDKGAVFLAQAQPRPATAEEMAEADSAIDAARSGQRRAMVGDVAPLLKHNLEHRHWAAVAERCLGCANCTMVCPTCFCGTVEDTTDLSGATAERWRRWDSCFTHDFSYIHGGPIRRAGAARYRQWITHKLSAWWDQFGCSGCVGCGRCITWCPVGIDITEEARAIKESEGGS